MLYRIRHVTRYEYSQPVSQCLNLAHVLPRDTPRQSCQYASVRVEPQAQSSAERQDYFGNRSFHFTIEQPHQVLQVTAESAVEVRADLRLPALDLGPTCADALQRLVTSREPEVLLAREFCLDSPLAQPNADLREYASASFGDDRSLLAAVRDLTGRIYRDFTYDPHFTDVTTPLADVLEHRRGVCQDFAHLAIACVRAMGFPARYVSGYLETVPPPGEQKLVGSDSSHAWFAVFSPGEGWCEFDPTNDNLAGPQHIITAWGRDYADVAPLRGIIFGGGSTHQLSVSVDVARA